MKYFVYLIISNHKNKIISYVGYTSDINKRLKLHNSSKGAKFTRGRKWTLIYKKLLKDQKNIMPMMKKINLKKVRRFRLLNVNLYQKRKLGR